VAMCFNVYQNILSNTKERKKKHWGNAQL